MSLLPLPHNKKKDYGGYFFLETIIRRPFSGNNSVFLINSCVR